MRNLVGGLRKWGEGLDVYHCEPGHSFPQYRDTVPHFIGSSETRVLSLRTEGLALKAQVQTVVQFGHEKLITEISYCTNGKLLATTDRFIIKLWDVGTGMEFKTIYLGEGQNYPITHMQFVETTGGYKNAFFPD